MEQTIRPYEEADFDAVARIWREVGWIDHDDDDDRAGLAHLLSCGDAEVALLDGHAECLTHRTPGVIRYVDQPLPLCAVTAVTTSLIGRKQRFAQTLTARALQHGQASGAAVAALGIFEQGFYNLLGFASSSYDHRHSFDPASLQLDHIAYRPPARFGVDDSADVHAALLRRRRSHGAVDLHPPEVIAAELRWLEKPIGLGYRDDDGRITHGFWGSNKGEHGPLEIRILAYETSDQLLELLRLIRELGDQVRTVKITEPAHVQLQPLIREPMRQRHRTEGALHPSGINAVSWMQLRILDVAACVAARSWTGPEVAFDLTLTDPLADRVTDGWAGVGGDYTVRIGATSSAIEGHAGLPRLTADVGAFTRLWFGVAPATSLVASDGLEGTPELLVALDDALLLPPIRAGWDF